MATWNTREKNGFWKGGRSIASNGYVLIRVGKSHHLSDVRGYAYEHRIVAEQKLGRKLRDGEQVHHRNGNKQDNQPENIEVMQNAAYHHVKHRSKDAGRKMPGEENQIIPCACGCGTVFTKYDPSGRPRAYISGHNPAELTIRKRFLQAIEGGARLHQIAARTGQSLGAVKCMASTLVRKHLIARTGRGIYGKAN